MKEYLNLKSEINCSNNIYTRVLSVGLVALGLSSPWLFRGWMPNTSPDVHSQTSLFFAAIIGIIVGLFGHEYYRYLMVKLLGFQSDFVKKPHYKVIVMDYLTRWQAIAVTAAPFIDFTLIALLIMAFSNSWLFTTFAITMMTINFMLSAKDIYNTFSILKNVSKNESVRFTYHGYQVWGIQKDEETN